MSDPKDGDSWALRRAAFYGYAECVKLLIPISDPRANDSEALMWAALYEQEDIVDLLWDISDLLMLRDGGGISQAKSTELCDPTAALAHIKSKSADRVFCWRAD